MPNMKRLLRSLDNESRYCVLECSVLIEERISETLGLLLGIEWKTSKSLGYGSSSLSFNQKMTLIQDLQSIEKKDLKKFTAFIMIRNKFAHVSEVDSFKKYFEVISKPNQTQKELRSWFPNLEWESEDIEKHYKWVYFSLMLELNRILLMVSVHHVWHEAQERGLRHAQEDFMNRVKRQLQKTEKGKEVLGQIFKDMEPKSDG